MICESSNVVRSDLTVRLYELCLVVSRLGQGKNEENRPHVLWSMIEL